MSKDTAAAAAASCRVLIANRGEIACRLIRSCTSLGLSSVAVYTSPDALSPHVSAADLSICLGDDARAYSSSQDLLNAATSTGCIAIHPGYGFMSESHTFAAECEAAGLIWIGPRPDTIAAFGLKDTGRRIAQEAGVPVVPGTSSCLANVDEAIAAANKLGLPVILKAVGGGGGLGINVCHSIDELVEAYTRSLKQISAFCAHDGLYMEKFVECARHIEVQVFGDGDGAAVHLGERECSIQRRHQKVIEETPAPGLSDQLRSDIIAAGVRLAKHVRYRSAGTIEFVLDDRTKNFYFLECNTRLQVEHGITEMVTGVDIVNWQLHLQLRDRLNLPRIPGSITYEGMAGEQDQSTSFYGSSIEVRVYAEDPAKGYAPSPGRLTHVEWPNCSENNHVRVDTWTKTGTLVSSFYDPMLAKIMVHAPSRDEAVRLLQKTLDQTKVEGVITNLQLLKQVASSPDFVFGRLSTSFLTGFEYENNSIEVVEGGIQSSIQDCNGRTGLWRYGVPPSGALDDYSFRIANAMLGNDDAAAGIEFAISGPTLRFNCSTLCSITGASFEMTLSSGTPVHNWSSFRVSKGDVLKIGEVLPGSRGTRGYLCVHSGLQTSLYLGSRSTFPSGKLGGYQGRCLRSGDVLPIISSCSREPEFQVGSVLAREYQPVFEGGSSTNNHWIISVLPGPHANPDFFTDSSINALYSDLYSVHYNSNRLGIRLEGPKPTFTRNDGGEGGSHPSNVLDHVYAIGTINFTGDTPIMLGKDGPSLGGFVCPATLPWSQMWKMGQLRPGDRIKFAQTTLGQAFSERCQRDAIIDHIKNNGARGNLRIPSSMVSEYGAMETKAVLHRIEASASHCGAQYRLAGDRYVLIEYGPMKLEMHLRIRVHALEEWFRKAEIAGVVETCPGVRSCMIEYDQAVLPLPKLIRVLQQAEHEIPNLDDISLPIRVLHLPLAFNEKWTHNAIAKYMRMFRPKAAYLPSNVDFVAANNGLEGGAPQVRQIMLDASYMVLGLGDVYLGAPCAVPVNPLHRLVVPKYNPARSFTPEGAVGIGGSFLCIYPMESPGGYQLCGRTLPIWNTFGLIEPFNASQPWLLHMFDQIRFFEVSEDELVDLRSRFSNGEYHIKIEPSTFSMSEYNEMLVTLKDEIDAMNDRQRIANARQMQIDAETLNDNDKEQQEDGVERFDEGTITDSAGFSTGIEAKFCASVWSISVSPGDDVKAGDVVLVLEAMKMEYKVTTPVDGRVARIRVHQSQLVQEGQVMIEVIKADEGAVSNADNYVHIATEKRSLAPASNAALETPPFAE